MPLATVGIVYAFLQFGNVQIKEHGCWCSRALARKCAKHILFLQLTLCCGNALNT